MLDILGIRGGGRVNRHDVLPAGDYGEGNFDEGIYIESHLHINMGITPSVDLILIRV